MMKLRWSATSPYVRKVMMVVIERGLADLVERVPTDPWSADTDLPEDNPLGKVPALTLETGTTLFDSPVIVEYLDSLGDRPPLLPPAGPARWAALRLQAVADGICDAAILRRLEAQRPDGEKSATWMERQRRAVARALDLLESEAPSLDGDLTIGTLSVLVALGYLDFRFGHEDWRAGRPALAAWHEAAADRDSVRATAPPA
ncbi:glutathione S-transferase N-terminal domain-containing protein [Azospirillum picis]|uniref:Glutathione S-transferase n=1 Tax=Azospirillum picis TaxID=488438 RepID=A0ABU0MP00_9PROT|nr:glutathione S-transferase N-terminal domain-containing protein [Azospirillum picis]MBP2301356.1 glutathione S-transferase [Azospirillum picis]MDQ0535187.1 glutathione S-transferase [Azospirillum picis]